jgi:hypothetical protein
VRKLVLVSLTLVGVAFVMLANAQELGQRLGGPNGPASAKVDPNTPVPKLADGTIDLSGIWMGGGAVEIPRLLKPGELDTILQPWAKELMAKRTDGLDPYNYCMPGGPLRLTGGFAWRFVQHPTVNAKYIFQLQEANAHTYRQIFMDGRKHPEDPSPTWFGHSIGRWEGQTLVIDTVGLNDKFWLDGSGIPHTERLHLVERWTRPNFITLQRDVTVEDPGAYTRPFTVRYTATLGELGSEIMEYICIENNQYGLAQGLQAPLSAESEK